MKPQKQVTLVVWNNKQILIKVVDSEDFNEELYLMAKSLRHSREDPRWFSIEGRVPVGVDLGLTD